MDFVWKWKSDTQSTDDAQNMRKELNPEKKEQTKSAPGEKATWNIDSMINMHTHIIIILCALIL